MIEFHRDIIKLGHRKNKRRIKISQIKNVVINIFMSQQTAQQATRIKEEKLVATKEFPITIEIAKDSKKFCRDGENSVLTELTR